MCNCTHIPPGLGRGAILPGTPSPLLCLTHSHSIFYDSPRASMTPRSPLRGPPPAWLGCTPPAAPSMAAQTTQRRDGLFTPDSPVGSGPLEGRDQPWVPPVPNAEPGILCAQEMPRAKHRRSEFCSPTHSVQIMWFDQKYTHPIHFHKQNQSMKEKQAEKGRGRAPSLGLQGQKSPMFMSCLMAHRELSYESAQQIPS